MPGSDDHAAADVFDEANCAERATNTTSKPGVSMGRNVTRAEPSRLASIKRVRDVLAEADLAKQRARVLSRARVFVAAKYLGDTDPTIEFEAVERVLNELLIAANNECQRAQRLLGQAVTEQPAKAVRRRRSDAPSG